MTRPIGLGCMRLSTDPERDEDAAIATLRAARESGVTLFDTAAAYGHSQKELHHNERLLAKALGDFGGVRIVTKCGMDRPNGRWLPNGKRNAMMKHAEGSRNALGVDALDLVLLHAPDPKTKLATSVRALAAMKKSGLAKAVGLSNVTRTQLEEARAITEIAAVEVALSPVDEEAARSGVVERCFELGIEVLAHSPLGGPKKHAKLGAHEDLEFLATLHGVSAQTLVLAWLYGMHPLLTPIPGARRVKTAKLAAKAASMTLRDDERAVLDDAFPVGRLVRTRRSERAVSEGAREVILFVGIPAAGKTTHAKQLVREGFVRLSRDERGGTLKDLAAALDETLAEGTEKVLVDATYPTWAQRSRVLETAWGHGAKVRCAWHATSLADARVNAVDRMLERVGHLPTPEELKTLGKADPNLFPPQAQGRYRDVFEVPDAAEGFAAIERREFVRERRGEGAGIVVEIDAASLARGAVTREGPTLMLGWAPDGETAKLEAFAAASGAELAVCVHPPGPARCWCRLPLPGLVVAWMRREGLAKVEVRSASSAGAAMARDLVAAGLAE